MPSKERLSEPYFVLELEGQEVRRFDLDRPRTSIGRARESEIQIAVRGVSRTHALVLRDEQGVCTLKDLGSANGTFVNGTRIKGERVLEVGDVINFLDYALCFRREGVVVLERAPNTGEVTTPPIEFDKVTTQANEVEGPFLDDAVQTEEGPSPALRSRTLQAEGEGWEVDLKDGELGYSTQRLEKPVTTIGGEGAMLRISGPRIERHHSVLVLVDDRLLFVRISAVNIARVNGTARMVTFVEPGDEITIGGSTLVLRKS
jgi:pSer/pThr/pTyr-binding forkhead associated (FHA) protein